MGAPVGTRLIRREGRAGSAIPLHMAEVRSDNRGTEGAADERARKPGSPAGEGRHRTKPLTPRAVASNQSVAARVIPPERLPCAWAGPGATTRVMRSTVKEDLREGVEETGAKQRDFDGKQQPQWTSRAHGAGANGLKKETEEPGKCQDDKSTTCGQKRVGDNREAQGDSNSNPSGR